VYFSRLLAQRHPALCCRVTRVLKEHRVPVRFLEGTADIWIKDYAPVQVTKNRFIKFRYDPDYLRGCEAQITGDGIFGQLQELGQINRSDLVVDGGNVVAARTKVILTEKCSVSGQVAQGPRQVTASSRPITLRGKGG